MPQPIRATPSSGGESPALVVAVRGALSAALTLRPASVTMNQNWAVSSAVRASRLHREGPRFKSVTAHHPRLLRGWNVDAICRDQFRIWHFSSQSHPLIGRLLLGHG